MEYAIATFCYGDTYYPQTNRLISSLDELTEKPNLFVVTDEPSKIDKKNWVNVINIKEYNESYLTYKKNYFDFDFSVKRYSLLFALKNGFTKIILTDTDVVVGTNFNKNKILNSFSENSILGPVSYSFEKEINTNSRLGLRFTHYEKKFNTNLNKKNLWMPEDCVQYFNIENTKFNDFLLTWDECIKIKYEDKLANIPAGNIDEICFYAFYNKIFVGNNSNKSVNILPPKHDLWYRR